MADLEVYEVQSMTRDFPCVEEFLQKLKVLNRETRLFSKTSGCYPLTGMQKSLS